ncbi:MAG: cation transporter [Pseudonocardia sp.]|uniref:cation transporter n=1 Tax=Pseudonocardia sp. TaxID=60912 RepID=UPI001ACF5644|nr:cation transporter [Pseudonocardia sp.]MBN9098154.1 cation transporter [Pseudonocardia sp.]
MSNPDRPAAQIAVQAIADPTQPVDEQQGCAEVCCGTAGPVPPERSTAWHRAARQAKALSWFSLVWMTGEGVLGLIAGATAGSIALIGWALGSAIEGLAAIIVIWRFTGSRTLSTTAEGHAQKAVAVSFFLLAPYIAVEAVRDLVLGQRADPTVLGIVVTAASLLLMPVIGIAKQRLGRILDSGATAGEGVQNLLCAAQAGAVLLGLALTATLGWTWVDPVIALGLAAIAIREGRAAWRGEDCC